MFIVGTASAGVITGAALAVLARRHVSSRARTRARRATALGAVTAVALLLGAGASAQAAIVPTVGLATAANYSVLAGTTVTNTGPSVVAQNAGVSPGAAVVGFPPGQVLGVIDAGNATALQAQADLVAAYDDAANRPLNATTTGELGGLTLVGGVYSGPSASPLTLTGPLVLDGAGDPNSVFIFQTASTLITASASTVTLINGAQECNVFWQVGSSATLGSGSVFSGNILALTSITVTTGVTVHGRALARNGAVTLDNDVFTTPTCDLTPIPPTTTSTTVGATTLPGGAVTTLAGVPGDGAGTTTAPTPASQLPSTGTSTLVLSLAAGALAASGLIAVRAARREQVIGDDRRRS